MHNFARKFGAIVTAVVIACTVFTAPVAASAPHVQTSGGISPTSISSAPSQSYNCDRNGGPNSITFYQDASYGGQSIRFCGYMMDQGNLGQYSWFCGISPHGGFFLCQWDREVTSFVLRLRSPNGIKGMYFYDWKGNFDALGLYVACPNIGEPQNDHVTGMHPEY